MASIQQNINQLTASTLGAALGAAHLYQGAPSTQAKAKAKRLETRAAAFHQMGEEYADITGELSPELTEEVQRLHREAYATHPTAKRLQTIVGEMEENEAVAQGAAAAEETLKEQQNLTNLDNQRAQLVAQRDAAQKRIDDAVKKAQRERDAAQKRIDDAVKKAQREKELERQARMAYIMDTQTRRDRASYTQQWIEEAKRLGGKQ